MARRWSDQDIAASLNCMGMTTGQGKTWSSSPAAIPERKELPFSTRSYELNRLEPEAYCAIARIGAQPVNRLSELLPWNIASTGDAQSSPCEQPDVKRKML
jgi:hypothetical protein